MKILIKMFIMVSMVLSGCLSCFAETTASTEFSFYLPKYMSIKPLTSPVLIANLTNRNGNLAMPLSSKFRVITNTSKIETLYLKADVNTADGYENAMFVQGGQVYIAFTSLQKIPSSRALVNCKMALSPKDSPGVVAYPITSIIGAQHKYNYSKNKYEIYVKNGTTDVTVNVGSNVNRNTFASNDPKGFYQAVLSLTEMDI